MDDETKPQMRIQACTNGEVFIEVKDVERAARIFISASEARNLACELIHASYVSEQSNPVRNE